jgi:hypothetical protein
LTVCGYNAVSHFLIALDVAEIKDVEVGKAKLSTPIPVTTGICNELFTRREQSSTSPKSGAPTYY